MHWLTVLLMAPGSTLATGCSDGGGGHRPSTEDVWDLDRDGVPRFVDVDYLELEKIGRISRFRSGEGHDYSDALEHCRSMKHYFAPAASVDAAGIQVFAPIAGTVTRADSEWAGVKIEIESESHPAFRFVVFHVTPEASVQVGARLAAGQPLGAHVGSQTYSDIAVIVNDPTHQGRMVSYFETISDSLFQHYEARGAHSRQDFIITREERDADPLTCNGDTFAGPGNLPNWVSLN